jgi:hypothetical protein
VATLAAFAARKGQAVVGVSQPKQAVTCYSLSKNSTPYLQRLVRRMNDIVLQHLIHNIFRIN